MNSPQSYRRAIPADANIAYWRAPDGWELRCFDWPAANVAGHETKGSILFQGGRGDIFEKYLETFAHWHDLGWRVTSLDWRGQAGSGRLSENPHVGHVENFDIWIDDFRAFWAEWSAEVKGPRVVMGHSMGGHLVLRALTEGLGSDGVPQPDGAVLIAPMLGLQSPLGARLGERMAKLISGISNPKRAAWKSNERPATLDPRSALLTHDRGRYDDEIWWQQHKPELVMGPPSWQWLSLAFESTRHQREDERLKTMHVPTLFVIADADKLVRPKAALQVASALPDARVVRFGKESAHEILREVDAVRDRALGEVDTFLASRASEH